MQKNGEGTNIVGFHSYTHLQITLKIFWYLFVLRF